MSDEEAGGEKTNWVVVTVSFGLVAVGALLKPLASLPLFLLAVVCSACTLPLAQRLTPRRGRCSAAIAVYLTTILATTGLVFIAYPSFHHSAAVYVGQVTDLGQRTLQGTANLANTVLGDDDEEEEVKGKPDSIRGKLDGILESDTDSYGSVTAELPNRFAEQAHISNQHRFFLLFQFSIFLFAMQLLHTYGHSRATETVVTIPPPSSSGEAGEATPVDPGVFNLLSMYCLVRGLKGILLGLIVAVALLFGGASTWLILAAAVCFIGMISGAGPYVFLMLAIPAVIAAPQSLIAAGATGLAFVAMLLLETKLYWYLVILPVARWGHLPLHVFQHLRHQHTDNSRGTFRLALGVFQLVLSVLIVAALGMALVVGGVAGHSGWKTQQLMADADQAMIVEDFPRAVRSIDQVLESHPSYRPAMLIATEAHALAGNPQRGLEIATKYSMWKPIESPGATQPISWLTEQILSLQARQVKDGADRTHAFKLLLPLVMENQLLRTRVAALILEQDSDYIRALLIQAEAAYDGGDYQLCLDWAREGARVQREDPRSYYWEAKAHWQLRDLESANNSLQQFIRLGGDLKEADRLRIKINQ